MKDFPVTYAGGVGSFEDLELLKKLGNNHVDVTIGSALDLFGGKMKFEDVLAVCAGKRKRTFTRAIRKTALSALSAAAQLLFAHNQALPLYLILTDFHASMKSVKNKIQVNCNRKNSKILHEFS